jgi:hypothetical protein
MLDPFWTSCDRCNSTLYFSGDPEEEIICRCGCNYIVGVRGEQSFGSPRTERVVLQMKEEIKIICVHCNQEIVSSIYFCEDCELGPLCDGCFDDHTCKGQLAQ